MKLALDASMRTKDENGHLRVAKTVISKAGVDPYFGREIPDYERLGLDPDKVYHLLRCPDELLKGSDSFKGKQLLIKHIPVDADDTQKEYTIGAIGSDIIFDDDHLYSDLTFWDGGAIDLIESERMQELSAGYSYRPDMQRGEYKGVPYDGVMRDINGNHVALVNRGRIGRAAIISDSLPIELEFNMKLKKGALGRIATKLKTLAQDESGAEELIREVAENIEHKPAFDYEELKAIVGDNDKYEEIIKLIGAKADGEDEAPESPEDGADKPATDEQTQAERDNESEAMRIKEREERERKDRDRDRAQAMDAASIAKQAADIVEAKYQARDEVTKLVGVIALDGFADAKSVYAYALKQKGINTAGVNEAGMRQLVAMASSQSTARAMAQDSSPNAPSSRTLRFKQGV